MDIYLVGGAVRDQLLGRPVVDRDWVVVGATPGEMLSRGFRQVGADFPVFLHPDTGEEYALARTERKEGQGYHGFTVYSAPDVTLEQDLQRRDLTINAMAMAEDGTLIDPFGGQQDLQARQLRHVSEAFQEDPLRVLRTARFLARFSPLGFTISPETRQLMTQIARAGEIGHLVPERSWQEIQRALHESHPVAFFEALRECDALRYLIPELSEPECFEHSMTALRCLADREALTDQRVAALLSVLSPEAVKIRARALRMPADCQDLSRLTVTCGPAFRKGYGLTAEALLEQLNLADAWRRPERFDRLLDVFCCLPGGLSAALHTRIRQAVKQTQEVKAAEFVRQGLKGRELGEAMRQERLRILETSMARNTSSDEVG